MRTKGVQRWYLALIATALFCAAGARAEEASRTILVLDLKSADAERERARAFATVITHTLDDELSDATVYSGRDLARLADLEGEKSSVGCDVEENSCLSELADAMGARFVVYGTLSALGGSRFVELTVIDMEAARPVDRVLVKSAGVDELADKLARELPSVARALSVAMGTAHVPAPPKIEAPARSTRTIAQPPDRTLEGLRSKLAIHTSVGATGLACGIVGAMVGATLCSIGLALPTSGVEVRPIVPRTELIVGGLGLGTVCLAVGGGVGGWQLMEAASVDKEIATVSAERARSAQRF